MLNFDVLGACRPLSARIQPVFASSHLDPSLQAVLSRETLLRASKLNKLQVRPLTGMRCLLMYRNLS